MPNKDFGIMLLPKNPKWGESYDTANGFTEEIAISVAKELREMGENPLVHNMKEKYFVEYDETSKRALDKVIEQLQSTTPNRLTPRVNKI